MTGHRCGREPLGGEEAQSLHRDGKPKLSAHQQNHLTNLHQAGTNEGKFHKAFIRLRDDARLDDQAIAGIAGAYCGRHGDWPERGIALGAIETHFYRQRDRDPNRTIEGRGDRRHG